MWCYFSFKAVFMSKTASKDERLLYSCFKNTHSVNYFDWHLIGDTEDVSKWKFSEFEVHGKIISGQFVHLRLHTWFGHHIFVPYLYQATRCHRSTFWTWNLSKTNRKIYIMCCVFFLSCPSLKNRWKYIGCVL